MSARLLLLEGVLTEDLSIRRICSNAVDYREAELPLGEVFAVPFVIGVLCTMIGCSSRGSRSNEAHLGRLQIHVVIPDLEEDGYEVDKRYVVAMNLVNKVVSEETEHTHRMPTWPS